MQAQQRGQGQALQQSSGVEDVIGKHVCMSASCIMPHKRKLGGNGEKGGEKTCLKKSLKILVKSVLKTYPVVIASRLLLHWTTS